MKTTFNFLITLTLMLLSNIVYSQSVPSYVPTNGLVGWWGFNGNAQDGSGNGNHGTVNGATLTTDRLGNQNGAYDFDGVSSFIDVSNNSIFNLQDSFSISCWISTNDILRGQYIINKSTGGTSDSWLLDINIYGNVATSGVIRMLCGGVTGIPPMSNSVITQANTWYNITSTYDKQNVRFYVNGNFINSITLTAQTPINTQTVRIGAPHSPFSSGAFGGYIDDIGIWNRALTQQEITNLYNSQSCQVSVTTQPSNQTTGTNRNVQFSVASSDTNSTYRWQSNSGFGFQDLYNAGQYSGVTTSTLNVSNTSPQNDNQLFRCIVSTTNCGSDTSDVVTLNVNTSSTSTGVPNKFTYQSVVRDTSGQLVTNQPVGMRLSLQRGPQMTNLYTETHQLTTNSNGLLTCIIGSGQSTLGMMDTIDWSLGNVYIQTEIDLTGGNNFVTLGNQELLSVPYALYSLSSGSSTPGPQGPAGSQGPIGPIGPQGSFPPGTQPGEMNYWNGTTWVSVPPGTRGQYLIFCDGVPTWGGCLPQVTTSPVTSIAGVANTGGNVVSDGGLYVSAKGVVYDTIPSPTLANRYTINGSDTGSFTSELGVLISFIPYYIRAYATNRVGTAYGNVVNFTSTNILPSVITEPVTFVNGVATSGGNVLSDGGAFITAKGVVYDTLPSPTLSSRFTIDGSDTGSFTCSLRELIVSANYYLRSYATNSVGTAYGNQVTFTAPLAVGNIFGGGTVFYVDSTGQHGLVCAPSDQGNFEWGCWDTDILGTSTAFGTGQANTNLILAGCSDRPIAASVCDDLVLNGYSDWYLPSRDELQLMYSNLYALGIGGFSNNRYWSSSQDGPRYAWLMAFDYGYALNNCALCSKGANQVRAVRAF